jgi:multidrug resistance efflux pump
MTSRTLSVFVTIVALSVALAACSPAAPATPTPEAVATVKADDIIVAEGRLEPVRYTQLALNANGLVSEVLLKEGDTVTPGQVIARLENSEARTLEQAQADALQAVNLAYQEARDAQYDLDEFDVPTDFAGMTPEQAVDEMLKKLNAARDAFEPYKYMSEERLRLRPNEEQSPVYRDVAKQRNKELDDAWTDYRKAIKWLNLESTLESANAKLAQSQKDYAGLQDASFGENTAGVRAALASAELRSPFGGTITNLDLKVGEYAAAGTQVVTVADFSGWVVKTTDLTEIDVVNIKEGQPVTVSLDAIPEASLNGYVLSIGHNYSEKQGDVVYEVTVLMTDEQPAMRWGMTAEVNFRKGE